MIGFSDIKRLAKWLTNIISAPELLKEKDKEITRLRRRIRKLEKSIK